MKRILITLLVIMIFILTTSYKETTEDLFVYDIEIAQIKANLAESKQDLRDINEVIKNPQDLKRVQKRIAKKEKIKLKDSN